MHFPFRHHLDRRGGDLAFYIHASTLRLSIVFPADRKYFFQRHIDDDERDEDEEERKREIELGHHKLPTPHRIRRYSTITARSGEIR